MSNILVTGAAGFIGSWTCEALLSRGDKVIGLDNFNSYYDVNLKKDRVKKFKDKCKIYVCDIADNQSLQRVFKQNKIHKVCHLAAQAGVRYSLTHPHAYQTANLLGTLNLLEACKHHHIKSFIYASSSSVYGGNTKVPFSVDDPVEKPISLYAATKRSNELMAYTYHHLYGMHCTGLRFFTVYGPWGRPDMALFKFTKSILSGKPIDVYNHGKMQRDFTYITDIVQGILSSLDKNYPCQIFNLGNSHTVNLMYFIKCIEKELGQKAKIKFLPIQPGDVPKTNADIKKSTKMLGFKPKIQIEQGIENFMAWYKDYYKIIS